MKIRSVLLIIISLLLPALCLAAPKKNTSVAADRAIKPVKNLDGRRIALVIGNSAYTTSPLKNPVNDSKDVAAKLRALGFDVIERSNLKTRQIGGTLREFRSKLEPGAVALVFYAGHGLQIKGENYLPAVDAEISSEEDVPNQSLAMRQIMDLLDESKSRLNLVFLDACRNNPYARSFRSADSGLARVNAPSGTLISYATRPGSVAADGSGRNGLYTSKLLAQMDSNHQIEQSLKRVVTEVKAASGGKQEPWMEGSIEGDFCFGGCTAGGGIPPSAASTQPGPDSETEAWNIVKATTNAEILHDFLKEYPRGRYATPARLKLKELESKTQVAMAPRPQAPPAESTLLYKDPQTGLIWPRNGNIAGKTMNWHEAMAWVKTLNHGGYSDWRLPTEEELEAFAKRGGARPSAWFNANGFSNVQSRFYLSSSSIIAGGVDTAWVVLMSNGLVVNESKFVSSFYVWPVRAGQ